MQPDIVDSTWDCVARPRPLSLIVIGAFVGLGRDLRMYTRHAKSSPCWVCVSTTRNRTPLCEKKGAPKSAPLLHSTPTTANPIPRAVVGSVKTTA